MPLACDGCPFTSVPSRGISIISTIDYCGINLLFLACPFAILAYLWRSRYCCFHKVSHIRNIGSIETESLHVDTVLCSFAQL